MNTGLHEGAVVVGVDASEAAFRAARLAADEAVRRSALLNIIHALTWFDGMATATPSWTWPATESWAGQIAELLWTPAGQKRE